MNKQLASLLSTGLQEMKLELSNEKQQQLLVYLDLLQKWNKTYNLTAVKEPNEMVIRHLLDSLAALPYLDRIYGQKLEQSKSNNAADSISNSLLDVGTGAGLPGLILGIARPQLSCYLLDSLSKRTLFLDKAARELKLTNITIINSRVELYQPDARFAVITSRAFSSLRSFIDSTCHLSDEKTVYLAFKGRHPDDEILAVRDNITDLQSHTVYIPHLDAERHVIQFKLMQQSH